MPWYAIYLARPWCVPAMLLPHSHCISRCLSQIFKILSPPDHNVIDRINTWLNYFPLSSPDDGVKIGTTPSALAAFTLAIFLTSLFVPSHMRSGLL